MKYSFIIPTYNRLNELQELIPSINELNYNKANFELIIVDDGSTDDTESYIRSLSLSFELKYHQQANQGPGAARNKGMSLAEGEYFLFVDSDCILPADYLYQMDLALNANDLDAFGGPDTFHPSFSPLLKAINYSMTSFLGTGGTRGSTKSIAKYYPRSFNMGIKREVFDRIGGFGDLRHGQDMDYSARIYAADFKVGFVEEAYVYHKRRTSFWKFFKQIHNWGVTRINLAAMHPDMLKPIHLLPAMIVLIGCIIMALSIFLPLARLLLIIGLGGMMLISAMAFFQSYRTYKSLNVALLSIFTLIVQVGAYGIGSLNGIWQKWILKKPVAIGITKNYYGK